MSEGCHQRIPKSSARRVRYPTAVSIGELQMTKGIRGSRTGSRASSKAEKAAKSSAGVDVTERIRLRAYSIWEREGNPDNRHEDHWYQAEREILHEFDILEGDDMPNLAALREAARQHTDTFIVASDLIDADQREATPGMREQP
jgi:hypothetical protein